VVDGLEILRSILSETGWKGLPHGSVARL